MKLTKEYPATHSMATSWFAIDEDGKVALLNFEDNGPVPCPPARLEQSPESLIEGEGDERWSGVKYLNYTDEQVKEMFREAPEGFKDLYNPDDDYFFDYVQINSSRTDEFLSILEPIIKSDECALVCFNKNVGIYNLDDVKMNKDVFGKLKASGCIVKVLKLFVDYDFMGIPEYAERLSPIPFFVYNQDYDLHGDLVKVYTPTMPPFTESQLSEFMRKSALRIKGKFSETQHVQPASNRPFISHEHLERRFINGQVYYRMRLTGNSNEEAYIYDSLLSCEKIDAEYCKECPIFDAGSWRLYSKFLRGDELTNHPTIGLIIDGDSQREYMVRYDEPDWVYKSFITSAIQCESAYDEYTSLGNAYKLCQQVGDVPVFKHCKVYFERIMSIFKPNVLVLSEISQHLLLSVYEHDEIYVTIAGERYPFFALNEAKEHKGEILQYANKPYRGKVIPKSLSVEEAESIGLKDD